MDMVNRKERIFRKAWKLQDTRLMDLAKEANTIRFGDEGTVWAIACGTAATREPRL